MFQINRGALPPSSQRSGANILLLTNAPEKHIDLTSAGKQLGHHIHVVVPKSLKLLSPIQLEHRLSEIRDMAEVVIPYSKKPFSLKILKKLEERKMPSLNSSGAIIQASNQLKTLKAFSKAGIPIPKTAIITNKKYDNTGQLIGVSKVQDAIDHVGLPCVFKGLEGSGGDEVFFPEDTKKLKYYIKQYQSKNKSFLIQELIKGAVDHKNRGRDVRALILSGNFLVAMLRQAKKEGERRANLKKGGEGFPFSLTETEQSLAEKATKSLGLNWAGIDMLPTDDPTNPFIFIEGNPLPGRKIGNVTGVDVITPVIEAAAEKIKASKVEAPQRELSLIS